MPVPMQDFQIAVGDDALTDLKARLTKTRYSDDFANAGWAYGTRATTLRELVEYWRDEYDWRRHETAMNRYRHYRCEIEGMPIHFMHVPGRGAKPLPLVLTHGWPWTFWDWHKVLGPLSDPAAHGGDPADAFDLVVPSLPGYGFSSPLRIAGVNWWRTADLWVSLMRDVMGYPRFAAAGGDWGGLVTEQLGHKYPELLHGVFVHFLAPMSFFGGFGMPKADDYAPDEQHWIERNKTFFTDGNGYVAIQSTRPQTLAYGLNDSPAGLAAWILEKRRAWSQCDGEVERRFSKDELCTTMTLYWVTQTFGTSARYYYEAFHNLWKPEREGNPVVRAPTGVAVFPGEVFAMPRRWAERYTNLKRWSVMPAGGHFAPMEEPDALVGEIRACFRDLR